eukprot:TRINITY_DN11846_c0_g1_i1.p1 TRINITY_DN11846_c0_g1~~TRINITY_DN11846_c0_g1_i1.p1  ORF type:complete len:562 (-),score=85.15 TRINITY_DN11846_c0_g1_i1:3-1472(-)
MAQALTKLGVKQSDRVATIAFNTYRHMELYYAISGMGAITHTINPRLFPEQLIYIINHAEDTVLLFDLPFVPLVEKLKDKIPNVKTFVVMTDKAHMPKDSSLAPLCYEELVAAENGDFKWPTFSEGLASSMCYTSGTTGNPKGVLYSHRSSVLHSWSACMKDILGVSSADSILLIVPLFHANAWGIPYAGAMCGAKLVMPGKSYAGNHIYELLKTEDVTMTAGVPTVFMLLLGYLEKNPDLVLTKLQRCVSGGSSVPRSLIIKIKNRLGSKTIHAWGMTETSPIGVVGTLLPKFTNLSEEEELDIRVKQGRGLFGVDLRIVNDKGEELPWDGEAFGALQVRGPWVCQQYYGEKEKAVDAENWFDTGDVATIDENGYMHIVDRTKDVIKSGGEWISSIAIENKATMIDGVAEAAVIGVTHEKWQERPLLIIVKKEDAELSKETVLKFFEGKIAKWWIPNDVIFASELPHTATGKVLKKTLREIYKDHKWS